MRPVFFVHVNATRADLGDLVRVLFDVACVGHPQYRAGHLVYSVVMIAFGNVSGEWCFWPAIPHGLALIHIAHGR